MTWLKPLLFASIALALGAVPASGLSILPNPVPVNQFGIIGSIELVDVLTGLPAGGVVGDGTVGASDTTLVFEAHVVESFPFDAWNLVALRLRPVGGTSFVVPTATGGIGTDFSLDYGFIGANGTAIFLGEVLEGETSNEFFVSYASPIATDGSLELFFQAGEGVSFARATALVVPEPGTSLLLAVGTGLIAARSARSRRIRGSRPC